MLSLILEETREKMDKSIDAYKRDLATVRTGRANPTMLDRVMVMYWGEKTPLNQVAGISVVEGRQLLIKPYDRSILRDIERAIFEANLGLTPQNDGTIIRITVPPLTEERRRDLCKDIKKQAEDSKVSIRSSRRDAIEKIKAQKKDGEITEDDVKSLEKKVQDITDKYCKEADELASAKEKEIMSV